MTTCCGDYHYADCPSLSTSVCEPEYVDDQDYVPCDPEPFEDCCEVGDWDGIETIWLEDGRSVTTGWTCIYCGSDVSEKARLKGLCDPS